MRLWLTTRQIPLLVAALVAYAALTAAAGDTLTETGTGSRPSRSPSGGVITGRVVGTVETMTDSAGAESRGIHRSGYGTQVIDHGAVGVLVLSWAAATFGVRGTTTICTSSS